MLSYRLEKQWVSAGRCGSFESRGGGGQGKRLQVRQRQGGGRFEQKRAARRLRTRRLRPSAASSYCSGRSPAAKTHTHALLRRQYPLPGRTHHIRRISVVSVRVCPSVSVSSHLLRVGAALLPALAVPELAVEGAPPRDAHALRVHCGVSYVLLRAIAVEREAVG